MNNIVYLGPEKMTFSYEAYCKFSERFNIPLVDGAETKHHEVTDNSEVIPTLIENGGYGVVAIDTYSSGRVTKPLETIMGLLQEYTEPGSCPVKIVASMKMPISFAAIKNADRQTETVGLIAHPKALKACSNLIHEYKAKPLFHVMESGSNGYAAVNVATNEAYFNYIALAPASAADAYDNLEVIRESCENEPAYTTFFLLTTKGFERRGCSLYRSLIIFETYHQPGALVNVLEPIRSWNINMVQVHSMYVAEGRYSFAVEIEFSDTTNHGRVTREMKRFTTKFLELGPYEYIS